VNTANKASVAFVLGERGVYNGDGSELQESNRPLKSSELQAMGEGGGGGGRGGS